MWYVIWNGSVYHSIDFEYATILAKFFVGNETYHNVALICKYDVETRNIKMWAMRWLSFGAFEMLQFDI